MMKNNDVRRKLLGILGGLGPMSSAYFYELITKHTRATRDQEHMDVILSSRASTPDRTDFILGRSAESPLPVMIEEARALEAYGASVIVIPCNTAHYFIDEVRKSVRVPVPSIIEETARRLKRTGVKKACVLATEGTIASGSYQRALEENGVLWDVPDEQGKKALMEIIYDDVKSGVIPSAEKLYAVAEPLFAKGCDCAVLGCTELSLLKPSLDGDPRFLDSLEVLARVSIAMMEREYID